MRYDILLINSLLVDESLEYPEKYRKLNSLRFPFEARNRVVLDFVINHYDLFGKLPDRETIKEKYPAFELLTPPEPFQYYIDEARNFKLKKELREKISRIEGMVERGDAKQAYEEFLTEARQPIFEEEETSDINLKKDIDGSIAEYQRRRDTEDPWGLCTGFDFIDNPTLGMQEGDFWVLAARPKSFKTWMICKMYQHIAFNKTGKFLFFSKEMPKHEIEGRLLSIIGNFDYQKYLKYEISDEELARAKKSLEESAGEAIIIGQEPGQSFDLGYVKSKIYHYEPSMVVIDGLYLMSRTTDWKDITDVTRKARNISLETGIPIFATWQLNRGSSKKKMMLDDLAYADALSQDATAVIMQSRIVDEVTEQYTNTIDVEIVGSRRGPSEVRGKVSIGFKSMQFVIGEDDPDGAHFTVDSLKGDLP